MTKPPPAPRLPIELVPDSLSQFRFAQIFRSTRYERLLAAGLQSRSHYACETCNEGFSKPRGTYQEVWSYESAGQQNTQRLVGFRIVCAKCHAAIRMSGKLAVTRWLKLIQPRLCEVNGWTVSQTRDYIVKQVLVFQERNSRVWIQDIAPLEQIYHELTDEAVDMDLVRAQFNELRAVQTNKIPSEDFKGKGQRFLDLVSGGPLDLETGLRYCLYAVAVRDFGF